MRQAHQAGTAKAQAALAQRARVAGKTHFQIEKGAQAAPQILGAAKAQAVALRNAVVHARHAVAADIADAGDAQVIDAVDGDRRLGGRRQAGSAQRQRSDGKHRGKAGAKES